MIFEFYENHEFVLIIWLIAFLLFIYIAYYKLNKKFIKDVHGYEGVFFYRLYCTIKWAKKRKNYNPVFYLNKEFDKSLNTKDKKIDEKKDAWRLLKYNYDNNKDVFIKSLEAPKPFINKNLKIFNIFMYSEENFEEIKKSNKYYLNEIIRQAKYYATNKDIQNAIRLGYFVFSLDLIKPDRYKNNIQLEQWRKILEIDDNIMKDSMLIGDPFKIDERKWTKTSVELNVKLIYDFFLRIKYEDGINKLKDEVRLKKDELNIKL